MAARATWTGALSFGPFPINLAAYPTIASKAGQSFKGLCECHGQPIKQHKVCAVDGTIQANDQLRKGVEVARNDIREVPREAADQIGEADRSTTLEIVQMPLRVTVPLHLATAHFRLVPNAKVPGSDQGVNILWNGLRASERVIVTEWVVRSGSAAKLVVIEATEPHDGHLHTGCDLIAHELPYATALSTDAPEFTPEVNPEAEQVFVQFAQVAGIDMEDGFIHSSFRDRFKERRDDLIAKALSGQPIEVPDAPANAAAPPQDLMAAMSAMLDKSKPTKSKSKSKAKA